VCRPFGAVGFTDRAARELPATGEAVTRRDTPAPASLTAQDRQIAGLARDGLTNPEIGAQLFLSPHTVEWHLRKVFAKLCVTLPPTARLRPRRRATDHIGPGRLTALSRTAWGGRS
jgi:DNA-binding NarL/FixJ family response regulator